MEKMTVETSLMQEVLDYLANRPYREVSGLVTRIMNAAVASNPPTTQPDVVPNEQGSN